MHVCMNEAGRVEAHTHTHTHNSRVYILRFDVQVHYAKFMDECKASCNLRQNIAHNF